jgi:hypothetical protein
MDCKPKFKGIIKNNLVIKIYSSNLFCCIISCQSSGLVNACKRLWAKLNKGHGRPDFAFDEGTLQRFADARKKKDRHSLSY